MTEGGFKRWQDDPTRRLNVEQQIAHAQRNTKLFCPELQEELPPGLRGLDAAVFSMIRTQIKQILEAPEEAFLLTSGQLDFLADYGRTVHARRTEQPPLPKEFYSGTVLGGSLHALRQRPTKEGSDEAKAIQTLSTVPSVVATADSLRDILGKKVRAIASKQADAVAVKPGASIMPNGLLQGDLAILAHSLKMQNWNHAYTAAFPLCERENPKDVLALFMCAKAYARYVLDGDEAHARVRIKDKEKAELLLEAFLMEAVSRTSKQFDAAKEEARKLLVQIQQLNEENLHARDLEAAKKSQLDGEN